MTSLEGRRLIVIGAGSNAGRQLAQSAAAAGAELVVAGPEPRASSRPRPPPCPAPRRSCRMGLDREDTVGSVRGGHG